MKSPVHLLTLYTVIFVAFSLIDITISIQYVASIYHKFTHEYLGALTLIRWSPFYGIVHTDCLKGFVDKDLFDIELPNGEQRSCIELTTNDCLGLSILKLSPKIPPLPLLTDVKYIPVDSETIVEDGQYLESFEYECDPITNPMIYEGNVVKKVNETKCSILVANLPPLSNSSCPTRPIFCIKPRLLMSSGWSGFVKFMTGKRARCGEPLIRKTHNNSAFLLGIAYPSNSCCPALTQKWLYVDLQGKETQNWVSNVTKSTSKWYLHFVPFM